METKAEACCGSCYYWRHRSEKDYAFNRFYCVLPGHSHNIFPDDGPCDEYAPRLQKEADDELAGFLCSNEWGRIPKSEKGWLDWLRQEAEQ